MIQPNDKTDVWAIEAQTGYTPKTDVWQVLCNYNRTHTDGAQLAQVVQEWAQQHNALADIKIYTELAMALNWQVWALYDDRQALARAYNDLWTKYDIEVDKHFTGDDLTYYFRTTD